ncbi:MAG TPA: hypothetical protein PKZ12_04030 [Smithellaceae bacterium]|nr:hypothetical protein [Smithellaceae bacterium]
MKRALLCILGVTFLLSAIAYSADKPSSGDVKNNSTKAVLLKTTKMNARGKVIEISDKTIKIERSVKDKAETMEFILEKAAEKIAVGDNVGIAYFEKDGQLIASRVTKKVLKKAGKKEVAPGEKQDKK